MTASETPEPLPTLLARGSSGDEGALATVLQQYETRLRSAAHALIGPALRTQIDSLDLVQSVHRALLPGLRDGKYGLTHPEQLLALALTVIRNKVVSKWRHMKPEHARRTPNVDASSAENDAFAANDSLHVRRSAKADPWSIAGRPEDDPSMAAQVNDSLRHVLKGLNPADRRLLKLRVQGYSTAEIAVQLQCDAHALRARLSRLRQRLREFGAADPL